MTDASPRVVSQAPGLEGLPPRASEGVGRGYRGATDSRNLGHWVRYAARKHVKIGFGVARAAED